MEWVGQALSSLVTEYPGSDQARLQTTGMLSKPQIKAFFQEASVLLDRPEIKASLRATHEQGGDVENEVTRLQELIFRSQGIDGPFGITCLGRLHAVYKSDPELLQAFIDFVNREETAVEEAEMLPEAFQQKQLLKQRAQARSQELLAELERLPPEEKEQFGAQAFVQQQEEACKQLQAAFFCSAAEGETMSGTERQKFFQSLSLTQSHD